MTFGESKRERVRQLLAQLDGECVRLEALSEDGEPRIEEFDTLLMVLRELEYLLTREDFDG